MNSRWLRVALIVITSLILVYYLGPRPAVPVYDPKFPQVPEDAAGLEKYICQKEARHIIKPDNEARIVWHDSLHAKTEYAVVYLHGFSASQGEGNPVHLDFAKRYGCNLFLSRLDAHGLDTSEPLLTMTATGLWQDAKEALAIGKALGEKVILMGTSTGGTLALELAANYPNDVYAVINLSPNIEINNEMAFLANNPWGLQLSRLVMNGNYNQSGDTNALRAQYWYNKYRLEAVGELEALLETTMVPATFRKIKQPVLNLYYYKDINHQDPTVKVSAILKMENLLGTADSLKEAVAIPEAGSHVIGCYLTSHDVKGVERVMFDFAQRRLKMDTMMQKADN
ncbi:alpha/beta hydrolase [Chitinophaga sancti]|uniref:Alpha/beta hydrolase n=1 Tax=Chitinophaga sancti TaxID=1004 RepID=A0A1K1MLY9_9BACT|nr:alpha/beta hydrolase [Chitinophaga sancti]WQD62796.1 alpha/beta hydrolase [Chitinophaga sancti]WQG91580.1 alpha/beta hydrolase [Chitinophaga sancti]SFW24069.1 Esterase/lipase [Chitinophaga sancti]